MIDVKCCRYCKHFNGCNCEHEAMEQSLEDAAGEEIPFVPPDERTFSCSLWE